MYEPQSNASGGASVGLAVVAICAVLIIGYALKDLLGNAIKPKELRTCRHGHWMPLHTTDGEAASKILAQMRSDKTIKNARNAYLLTPHSWEKEVVKAKRPQDGDEEGYGYCDCSDTKSRRIVGNGQFCEEEVTKESCGKIYETGTDHLTTIPSETARSWNSAKLEYVQELTKTCACEKGYGFADVSFPYECVPLLGGFCKNEKGRDKTKPYLEICTAVGIRGNNDFGEQHHCCCGNCEAGGCYDWTDNTCDNCGNEKLCLPKNKVVTEGKTFTYVPLTPPQRDDGCKCQGDAKVFDPDTDIGEGVIVANAAGNRWTWGEKGELRCYAHMGEAVVGSLDVPCLTGVQKNPDTGRYECQCNCPKAGLQFNYNDALWSCCPEEEECEGTCLTDLALQARNAETDWYPMQTYCATNCMSGWQSCTPKAGCCDQCHDVDGLCMPRDEYMNEQYNDFPGHLL